MSGHKPEMKAIDTLRLWAELGRLHRAARRKQRANWAAVDGLIKAARPKLKADASELKSLLEKSRKGLAPFDDPFDLDLGLHRWLAEDREESYSDWLQWIVKQVSEPCLVYRMFDLPAPDDIASWPPSLHVVVKREQSVAEGHDGHSGRLDMVIRFPGRALIIVEVKDRKSVV